LKRFTDTDLWNKQWFMELTPAEKIAWFYIKDACDHVGVWSPNFRLAEFVIGMQLDWKKFMDKTNGNIEELENGKWYMPDFCDFQYGELKDTCKPHVAYMKTLAKHGLFDRVCKGYAKGMDTLQEKEKETDIETDKEKEAAFDAFWNLYPKKASKKEAYKSFCKAYKSKTLPDNLLDILSKWIHTDDWKKDKGQFIPYPSTWLNQERWNDELPVSTQPATADYVNVAKPVCRFEE
jgi:hypothetical protein